MKLLGTRVKLGGGMGDLQEADRAALQMTATQIGADQHQRPEARRWFARPHVFVGNGGGRYGDGAVRRS